MKIPNYVLDLIIKRQRYVEKAMDAAYSLQEWLDKNEIYVEGCDEIGGTEMFLNPNESAHRVIDAIIEKK